MSKTQELIDKLNEYASYVKSAETAQTLAEVDNAKVEGIKALHRMLFLLDEASKDIYEACNKRRQDIMTENRIAARQLATQVVDKPVNPKEEVIQASKPKKKISKKAKK